MLKLAGHSNWKSSSPYKYIFTHLYMGDDMHEMWFCIWKKPKINKKLVGKTLDACACFSLNTSG
jgi:hypothetical protein